MLSKLNYYLNKNTEWLSSFFHTGPATEIPGYCCFSMDAKFIYFAYAVNKELQFIEVKPYQQGDKLSALLGALVKEHGLTGARCAWVLQPGYYQLLLMDALPVPDEEFQAAIRWKVKGLLQFPIEDTVLDSFPMPPHKSHTQAKMITVVASRASYLKPIVESIAESGLTLEEISIADLALRNITSIFENDEKTSALIYLQDRISQFMITRKKFLYLERDFDLGLDQVDPNIVPSDPQLQKVALELQRSFDYYQGQWREPPPVRIFLATTKLSAASIATYLTNELALAVRPLDLSDIIKSKINLTVEAQGRCLPVIGGLLRPGGIEYAAN